jgi:hypothetical protein
MRHSPLRVKAADHLLLEGGFGEAEPGEEAYNTQELWSLDEWALRVSFQI